MSETMLTGTVRKAGRKGPARRLRVAGLLPGIVYGSGENVLVTVDSKDIMKILESKGGANKILFTKFEGDSKKRSVMIKYLDVHPISNLLLHIDLLEIDVTKPVRVAVKLDFTGVSIGVREEGGQMNVNIFKINVECLPADIPATIIVPVDDMVTDDVKRVKDIKVDPKIKVMDDPEARVVSIAMPKVEEEPEPEALAEGEEVAEEKAEGATEGKPDVKEEDKQEEKPKG